MSLLEIKDLRVSYGGIEALKGISFHVEEGQIVTLIGANGAGKSTTLRAISGLAPVKSGAILYDGQAINGLNPQRIVSMGVGMVPEGRRVFPNLTVLENLKIGAYLRRDDLKHDIEYVYSLFPRLRERSWQMAGTLSGGEQQMLAVGRALMMKPRILMMDEPSLGLAPRVIRDIFEIIKTLHAQGMTILLVEQNANAALKVADYAFVLHMLSSLDAENGRMAVVLPHGVLFRGASEGKIRRQLVEMNLLDAVIGLPANLFYGTGIPACILVFKKNRDVLFIDASGDGNFEKGKNQNILRDSDITRIVNSYQARQNEDKYSYVASFDEIKENDFNLNIPRYVDTFEEEELVDIDEVQRNIATIEAELAEVQAQMAKYLMRLGL